METQVLIVQQEWSGDRRYCWHDSTLGSFFRVVYPGFYWKIPFEFKLAYDPFTSVPEGT